MKVRELDYSEYITTDFPDLRELRTLPTCKILSAGHGPFLIIVDDPLLRQATLYECRSKIERARTIAHVVRSAAGGGEDGDAGSAVPASPRRTPPRRTAADAKPLPTRSQDEDLDVKGVEARRRA
jgi:hypothetical protein